MDTLKKQVDYWNKVAPEKEFTTDFDLNLWRAQVDKSAQILDVGCGYGRILGQLKDAGYSNLHGIDFAQEMILRGRALHPTVDFQTAPGDEMPFEKGSFDAVILFALLTCVVFEDAQRRILDEVRRVLKPDGLLFINDFLLNDDARNLDRYAAARVKFANALPYGVFELPEGALLRHHDESYLRELTSDFLTIRFERTRFRTMNGHESRGVFFLGRNP
ncbi:MAG: methyltransferase domain-containing protein [Planctomycetia bacterium]|nr:methyltransferase domain-containing protein [Planctomycetia bacterium]